MKEFDRKQSKPLRKVALLFFKRIMQRAQQPACLALPRSPYTAQLLVSVGFWSPPMHTTTYTGSLIRRRRLQKLPTTRRNLRPSVAPEIGGKKGRRRQCSCVAKGQKGQGEK